ncbi:MAG: ester cyclase [Steroidobacteraceae bacterium]
MKIPSWLNAGLVALALVEVSACNTAPPDYAAQYRPLQDTFVAVWNGGKLDALDAIVAPNYKRHGTGQATDDLVAFKKIVNDFRTAYPDLKVTIDDAYYVQDRGFYLWTVTGTNTGAGPEAQPPTGKSVKVSGMSVVRYEDGKIADEGLYYDQLDFNQQLGFTLTAPVETQ